jgi:N-acetylglutamate synthase-like GNAT family acetyltransferase
MVVLLDGEPAKSHYRKFKIRSLKAGEIDDFKAMEEVIYRRLRKLPRKLPKSFELRKAQKKDQDIIEQKLKKCKGDLREFDYRQWLILKLQDELIGLLRVREVDTKNSALISDLFLDEQFNGQGLSQFLLKKAVSQVKARKYYAICPKNSELEIFERFGFKLARHKPKELVSKSRNNCNYLVYTRQKLDQSFTSVPDLILIDGGKGQLSAALKSSSRFPELKIPICALAKREEQVFIPGKPEPTPITKDSRPGLLLQKIRDEAHRFAVSFNRNLRSSKAHLSALDQIEGIGPTTRKKLLRKFGSLANIKKASDEELLKLVNAKVLYRIKKL